MSESADERDFKSRISAMREQTKSSAKIFCSRRIEIPRERQKILHHFVKFALRALDLRSDYRIFIVDDRRKYGIKTTADYLSRSKEMFVYAEGRAFVDILRSIAHEFVHAKQHEVGLKFSHHYIHFDNDLEDEANKMAGEIVNAYSEVMGHDLIYEN